MLLRPGTLSGIRRLMFSLGLLISTPLLANKFETIGSGVQGSNQIKIEYLQIIAFAAGGVFFIAGILAIVLHNSNAQTLNYTMWRYSAALFFLVSIASVAAGLYMK
ncbi:MAG: hypothetical protein ABW076_17970 [Candidatus Thiodiazotropha sp.]